MQHYLFFIVEARQEQELTYVYTNTNTNVPSLCLLL